MTFDILTIGFLIGIMAGIVYYLDGWSPTPAGKGMSSSRRYKGLIAIVGGGVVSPLIDKYMFKAEGYDLFRGYLAGVSVGWMSIFLLGLCLYVLWKNTKDRPGGCLYIIGQIGHSILEVISFGISDNPQLQRAQEHQSKVDAVRQESYLEKLKEQCKRQDPATYIEMEEQSLWLEERYQEIRSGRLKHLKRSIEKGVEAPEEEAKELLSDIKQNIAFLTEEIETASNWLSVDKNRAAIVVKELELSLQEQIEQEEEISRAIDSLRTQIISPKDLSTLVANHRLVKSSSTKLSFGEISIGHCLLRILEGDITQIVADAVVSSDDTYLTMGGGVSKRIRTIGGTEIYEEAQKLVPLRLGDVAITNAGKLPALKVLHCAVIGFRKGEIPNNHIVASTINRCLEKLQKLELRSIAFPLIGTGVANFPETEALQLMFNEISVALSKDPDSSKKVSIVLHGPVVKNPEIQNLIKNLINTNRRFCGSE